MNVSINYESDKSDDVDSDSIASSFGKKIASAVPYTSRIQASAQYRKPNAAGQYDK